MGLWVIWLVAALLFGVGEMHAQGFVLAPLAVGALVAAGATLAGLGAALSVLVFLTVGRPSNSRRSSAGNTSTIWWITT